LTSLKEARNLLEKYALPGESLAYINDEESKFLKYMGGAGIPVNSSGVPSYFKKFIKKITKPVAKVLDKIVPNEIKPALPYLAAFAPFMLPPGFGSAMFSSFSPQVSAMISRGLVGAGANTISQLSQEGAAERDLSLGRVALAAIPAALSAPGAGEVFEGLKATDYYGLAKDSTGFLDSARNLGLDALKTGADYLSSKPDSGGVGDILAPGGTPAELNLATAQAASGPLIAGTAEKAYIDAQKALEDYNKQQEAMGELGVANTESRKAAIRKAMGLSGYTNDEIENTLLKFNFATGGRVGYQLGGGTKPPSMPINPDMLAMAIFGKSYDELTYTQKSAINDMLPNKKAEGGIMNLGGLEMDLRAKGGFVPIGRKEKADDVPARLSKNEFVMTANAVRGAGKGDVKKGAKRMYDLMRQYEAMA
jgi:hypothetical protein